MKSHESDQLGLAMLIYKDAIAKCAAIKPDLRDLETLRSRVEDEGLSFLTITLPNFGKDFERSLADGQIGPTFFRSFRKNGAIPAFLQGMLGQIFDKTTGGRTNETNLDILVPLVEGIRQIAYTFKKLEIDCTSKRVLSSLDGFVRTESELSGCSVNQEDLDMFIEVSQVLWNELIMDIDVYDLIPRHGPGATAEGVSGNQKYSWRFWHDRLEPYFPLLETAYNLGCYDTEEFENVTIVSEAKEQSVKVTPVPKTQKGPRIIAIEPCCMQYAQQAIRSVLYDRIERYRFTAGHVNFTDQSINKTLAMISSLDGQLATIDLSDASDRVLLSLAIRMFDGNPILRDAIQACRSTSAILPNGQKVDSLVKFASMGSALCFPVESMYFYTICVMALLKEHELPVTAKNVFYVSRSVYVYGDDILVPCEQAAIVVGYLHKYHCKVNMSKSFWNGNFRESCGMDAFMGEEVTPTYVRKVHPNNKQQAEILISWIKTAGLFYKRGYWLTARHMYSVVERYLGKLPVVSDVSPALGRISFLPRLQAGRWNKRLHRPEVLAWSAEPVYRTDMLDEYGALMKSLLRLEGSISTNPISDSANLERSARYGAVTLKRHWTTPY